MTKLALKNIVHYDKRTLHALIQFYQQGFLTEYYRGVVVYFITMKIDVVKQNIPLRNPAGQRDKHMNDALIKYEIIFTIHDPHCSKQLIVLYFKDLLKGAIHNLRW